MNWRLKSIEFDRFYCVHSILNDLSNIKGFNRDKLACFLNSKVRILVSQRHSLIQRNLYLTHNFNKIHVCSPSNRTYFKGKLIYRIV